jgi:hypothetical protein
MQIGLVSTIAGAPGKAGLVDGIGTSARLNRPYGVSFHEGSGTLYFVDKENARLRKITPYGNFILLFNLFHALYRRSGNCVFSL